MSSIIISEAEVEISTTMSTSMSSPTLTIDNLCEDVLRHIFDKYLDLRTQIIGQRVCKRFYSLIQSIFDGKRALHLCEDFKSLDDISDEDLRRYSIISVNGLYGIRDGLWMRVNGALRLLQSLDIQILSLKKHKYLSALSMVVMTRPDPTTPLTSLMDLIIENCSESLEKLIIININGSQLSVNMNQMQSICDSFPNLKHFEIFSDHLYATEHCFGYLLNHCKSLEVFKLNVKHLFSERIELLGAGAGRAVTYDSYDMNGLSFEQMSAKLIAIYGSHPILSNNFIANRLPQMSDRFINVRHLGVERISLIAMQTICRTIPHLESLSFSIHFDLENDLNQTKKLFEWISRLQNLNKLSIRWFSRYNNSETNVVSLDSYILNALRNCPKLTNLVIKDAVIRDQTLRAISNSMPSLESLHIMDCTLNMTSLLALINFTQLKELVVLKSFSGQTSSYQKFVINGINGNQIQEIIEICRDSDLIYLPPQQPIEGQHNDVLPYFALFVNRHFDDMFEEEYYQPNNEPDDQYLHLEMDIPDPNAPIDEALALFMDEYIDE